MTPRAGRPRTLRYSMIRLSWIMVAALLTASYLSFYVLLRHEANREVDRQLMGAALPVLEHFEATRDKHMADLNEFGAPGRDFEILDSSGHLLQLSRDLTGGFNLPTVDWATLNHPVYGYSKDHLGQSMRLVLLPFMRRRQHYVLAAAMSTFGSHHVIDSFGTIVAIIMPLSLLLAGLISAWYVDRSLEPVRALTRHAEQMAERAIHADPGVMWEPLPLPVPQDEIGRLASTFNRLFSHADAVMQQLRQFVTDASHEIRTPLAVLRGESELLLSGAIPAHEVPRTLEAMDQELRRLTHVVDGLFTLAMADAGQLRLVREPLYLNEVLEDACAFVEPRAAAKQIRVDRDLDAEVAFRGDEAFLHDLFVIFLDNAIKYSPERSRVRVTLEAEPGCAEIRFRDQGAGIPAGEVERIFERFYRSLSASAQSEPGSGLGLAIAHAIAVAHGGTIACASVLGEGTTFTLTLPRAEALSPAPSMAHAAS